MPLPKVMLPEFQSAEHKTRWMAEMAGRLIDEKARGRLGRPVANARSDEEQVDPHAPTRRQTNSVAAELAERLAIRDRGYK